MKNDKLLYNEIKQLIEKAKSFIVQNVNTTLVFTNYHIGKMIVEDEQQGNERAKYAERTLKNLSQKLTKDFRKGYSVDNLQRMRSFYVLYQNKIYATVSRKSLRKSETVSHKSSITKAENILPNQRGLFAEFQNHFPLSWSHYSLLIKIENEVKRNFYEIETTNNN